VAVVRNRREPPPFRAVEVERVEPLSPYLTKVTLAGTELDGLNPGLPAASLRLLLPDETGELTLPAWNGNEFLRRDGSRPTIRTLTPLHVDPDAFRLDVAIVRHGSGPLSTWVDETRTGERVAVSGTGRGYEIDPTAREFLLAGDKSALPALDVLLRSLPADATVRVHIEIGHPDARAALPDHRGATVHWHPLAKSAPAGDALFAAIQREEIAPRLQVWAAGEAAAMQRIRRHLFEERNLPRADAVIRGYWKRDRAGEPR
jgi:NADPH-dependent ferric siderophore reductase